MRGSLRGLVRELLSRRPQPGEGDSAGPQASGALRRQTRGAMRTESMFFWTKFLGCSAVSKRALLNSVRSWSRSVKHCRGTPGRSWSRSLRARNCWRPCGRCRRPAWHWERVSGKTSALKSPCKHLRPLRETGAARCVGQCWLLLHARAASRGPLLRHYKSGRRERAARLQAAVMQPNIPRPLPGQSLLRTRRAVQRTRRRPCCHGARL